MTARASVGTHAYDEERAITRAIEPTDASKTAVAAGSTASTFPRT